MWLEWSADAFALARTEAKPVLLSITALWCHGCAVMDRVTYADTAIVETINRRFVPVRVDADRRPDVNERYNLEGWPTTAFLTSSGEMLTGTTYLPPNGLRALLRKSRRHTKASAQELDLRPDRSPRRGVRAPRHPSFPWSRSGCGAVDRASRDR